MGFHNLVQCNENHSNFSKYTTPHENVMKTTLKIEHPAEKLSKPFEKHFPVHHPNGDPLKML